MSEIRDKLLAAYKEGRFLSSAYELSSDGQDGLESIAKVLVVLHNEGSVNIPEQFMSLQNQRGNGPDFFLTRHIFEKALPHLNAPLQDVMDCVAHLASEAGQDMAANWIFASLS